MMSSAFDMVSDANLHLGLADWCHSYICAFRDYDAAGIETHWLFPALIIFQGQRFIYDSAEKFSNNTRRLLEFYKKQGVVGAERELVSSMPMDETVAAMRVQDKMLDAAGKEIVQWQASYVLQKIRGRWRAIAAVADGEAAAWVKNGTPLGS